VGDIIDLWALRRRDISTNKVTTNTIHLGNNVTPIEK
jgi:hypothetical protein